MVMMMTTKMVISGAGDDDNDEAIIIILTTKTTSIIIIITRLTTEINIRLALCLMRMIMNTLYIYYHMVCYQQHYFI